MTKTILTKIGSTFLIAAIFYLFPPVTAIATSAFQDKLADDYNTDLFGFIDVRQGFRTQNDPNEKDASISEMRLQLDLSSDLGWGTFKLKGDVVGDQVEEEVNPELRELNLLVTPLDNLDLKMGRQVLTWGTGDMLFINDLFPKDWVSFFIGREDEYLKAPADAVKAGIFFDLINLDLVYMPIFHNSVYIDGSRLSYWNPMVAGGSIVGSNFIFDDEERLSIGRDSAFAMRLYRNIKSVEVALYGYHGFWSTPEGLNPSTGRGTYPRLSVYGASIRGSMLGGISNLEIGYYDSLDDQDGDDPFIRNSEIRVLAGFERELAKNFTGGVQYYLEYMQNYSEYEDALTLVGGIPKDEFRHVLTLRLTKLMLNQNLRLSIFGYYSPSDDDGYIRPKVHYKITDQWAAEIGGNIFFGTDDHTFFGQFEDNTNVYTGVRWNF